MKKIMIVKTNEGCFITDCEATSGYDFDYHKTKIKNYRFDDKEAKPTYVKNWFMIEKYPEKITIKEADKKENQRYELKDTDMESKKTPLVLGYDELDYEDDIYPLYILKYDIIKGEWIDADIELDLIMEVDNFELPPEFSYKGLKKSGFTTKEYTITNANIKHQLLDKLIIPEVLLSQRACSIGSQDLYNLVRVHVKENIDNSVAKITSDYDFCFTVKKIIPLYEPRKYTYTNPFASTKKARQKLHKAVQKYKESTIFEMTSTSSGYTPIQPITASSEKELKEKIDGFLEDLIFHINRPLVSCPHCQGTGFIEEVERFDTNKR